MEFYSILSLHIHRAEKKGKRKMRKVSKRTILIITMLALSMIPFAHAAFTIDADSPTEGSRYLVGDTIVVEGGGVTSGAVVNLYWDYVTTAGLVNSTTGNPDGSYEVSVDIPETPAGNHYLWVKDMGTEQTVSRRVRVIPDVDGSVSFGLAGEDVDVDGTGFLDDDEIFVYFGTPPVSLVERYGDSTADWATGKPTGGTEDVVKLVGDATSNANARVLIEGGPTLAAFDETEPALSFDYAKSVAGGVSPEIELIFTAPSCVNPYDASLVNRAHVEITIPTTTSPTIAWQTAGITAGTVWWFGNDYDGTPFAGTSASWAQAVLDINAEVTGNDADTTWTLTGAGPQVGWGVVGTYYVDNVYVEGTYYNLTSPNDSVDSDDFGSWSTTVEVPDLPIGPYVISGVGSDDFWNHTDFTIGAVIELDYSEGPSGMIVTVDGRGWTAGQTITFDLDGTPVRVVDDDVITVETDRTFEAEVIIPEMADTDEYELTATESLGAEGPASADFEVNGLPAIEVSPTYGAPGAIITVKGYNFTQISGTEVTLTLTSTPVSPLVTAETNSDGTFEDTFTSPAVTFDTYDVEAVDDYDLTAEDPFKVGLIAMIINPTSGPSGAEVALTGIGFADGDFNMTFGEDLTEYPNGVVSEAISETFIVPTVEPGVYNVVVIDGDENELSAAFTVTATTSLAGTPDEAAVGYNMSIYGEHFSEVAATPLTFYVYNSTWGKNTPIVVNETFGVPSTVTEDGNFTGYWVIANELLLGNTYTMNCTDDNDLYAEFDFVIVEEEVEIGPNKDSYSLGDTITFTIKATFAKEKSYLEITDPDDELIFLSTFTGVWESVGTWKVVRIMNQVNDVGMNPFMIPSDGTIGTWTWSLYDDDDEVIKNGTIEVLPTTAAQVDTRLSSVEDSLTGLSDDLGDMTTDLDDMQSDISSVMSDIGDVKSDLDNVKSDIISDLSDDIAAATGAANAATDAVEDLEDTVSDIADTANSAKTAADAAAAAATSAASAADEASSGVNGLTGLVYGAIGASLIAALAAIFAVMQISRRIAG